MERQYVHNCGQRIGYRHDVCVCVIIFVFVICLLVLVCHRCDVRPFRPDGPANLPEPADRVISMGES